MTDNSKSNFSSSLTANAKSSNGRAAEELISHLGECLKGDSFWGGFFAEADEENGPGWALHIAVFQEPYLTWVLEGRKTIESRFSLNDVAPFREVRRGDVIALKRVAGPIVGLCLVAESWSTQLDARAWLDIRKRFATGLCANDESFWSSRAYARYATLISIDAVREISPVRYPKSDRRGWLIARRRLTQGELEL